MTKTQKESSNKTSDTTKAQDNLPEILSQEELMKWWPFDRVNGKSLENLHKKTILEQAEQAPF